MLKQFIASRLELDKEFEDNFAKLNDIAERVNDLSNDIYFSKNTLKKLRYTL
jgi:hypothetical protein